MSTESVSQPAYDHAWNRMRAQDPEHSARYAQRWRDLAAAGKDLDGEARFVSALAAPGARVLDAGCGTGRVGGALSVQGYVVSGIDLDEILIAEAIGEYPLGDWHVGDLANFASTLFDPAVFEAPSTEPERGGFDLIVCAGNVLTFLDPAARLPALQNIRSMLAPTGRFVAGFGAKRGYGFDAYLADLDAAGFEVQHQFATWELHPFTPQADFLVSVATSAPGR